jgi:hypothetical protein
MAQDPTSHELDTVALYLSSSVGAAAEADIIRGILDSQGIPSFKQGVAGYPSLGFEVLVRRSNLQQAEQLLEEAKAAGPAAALDAAQAWETDT